MCCVSHHSVDVDDEITTATADRVAWIPGQVLRAYYLDDQETRWAVGALLMRRVCVEKVFDRSLINPKLGPRQRAARVQLLARACVGDAHCLGAVTAILRAKHK